VILAVHNGERFIRQKIESLLALEYPPELLEILIVSDGSTDDTEAIVDSFPDPRIRLLKAPRGGKAAALNLGLLEASGEILFYTDVRQPLDRQALSHLVANFADSTVGAVTGELRFLNTEQGEQADMGLYWRYELFARSKHSEIDSILNTTGCIWAMRKSLARPVPTDTLTDDLILPLGAFFSGFRVVFDGDAVAFDYPTVAGEEFGRRMRTLAGLWQMCARQPQLFGRANRMRLHFLSHKFARLMLPWAILAAIGATATLPPSQLRAWLLWFWALLVATAVVDFGLPTRFPLKRLTSPVRTFLVMNAAALISIRVFFVSPRKLWGVTKVAGMKK
jgi:cellulose synthase/poly-beta-1,6-N-acetylglucosamine synthase-like glycosyltransferase